jgi:PhzF family phenazine biosynthesis protein
LLGKEPKMKFYIVDAFTDHLFGGNPAGVVILSENEIFPSSEIMIKTAGELRYSETVFVQRSPSGEFILRYFTPTEEVDLCGHGTIATFISLLNEEVVSDNNTYTADTKAGNLEIRINGNRIMMDMAPPVHISTIKEDSSLKELYEIMGLDPNIHHTNLEGEKISADQGWTLYPEIISTGLPDIIMPVSDRKTLAQISPNFQELTRLSKEYGVTGVHAFTLGEGLLGDECCIGSCGLDEITAYCRNFAPAVGINEEAATGTANGALTYYLFRNSLLDEGTSCRFIQGESMNRASTIVATIEAHEKGMNISVGGSGAILANVEIYL